MIVKYKGDMPSYKVVENIYCCQSLKRVFKILFKILSGTSITVLDEQMSFLWSKDCL